MYRKPLLKKVIECKALIDELVTVFGCEPERLPTMLQIVLELASDGQSAGYKQASVEQGKTRPMGRPRKDKELKTKPKGKLKAKTKGTAKKSVLTTTESKPADERPKAADAILGVMKPFETISMDTMCERIVEKGWQPTSTNFKSYVQNLVSKEVCGKVNGRKGAIQRVGVNEYRLREWYVKSVVKSKPSKPAKVVPIRPETPTLTNGAASHG